MQDMADVVVQRGLFAGREQDRGNDDFYCEKRRKHRETGHAARLPQVRSIGSMRSYRFAVRAVWLAP